VISVVYLTSSAPSKLAEELTLAGYCVWEALAVSEVLHLCETHQVDAIIIGGDVDDPDLVEAQLRHITLKLKPDAKIKDILWELSRLFPKGTATVQ